MRRIVLRLIAWTLLAAIAAATLVPIGLRPQLTDPTVEHLVAFAVLGFLFAAAYPRHLPLILMGVLVAAALLELLQFLDTSRHPRWIDLATKVVGGVVGIAIGWGAPRKPGGP